MPNRKMGHHCVFLLEFNTVEEEEKTSEKSVYLGSPESIFSDFFHALFWVAYKKWAMNVSTSINFVPFSFDA